MSDATGGSPAEETGFRQRWYEAHAARFEADSERVEESLRHQRGFDASAPEALALRGDLARTANVEAFHEGMKRWATKPGTLAFNGFSGQVFLNQLVNRSDDHAELARVLSDALAVPR